MGSNACQMSVTNSSRDSGKKSTDDRRMTIYQKDLGSLHGPDQGLPVEARIFAAAAAVVSVVGLAIIGVTWMPWTWSFEGLEGIFSFLVDSLIPTIAAFALPAAAIAWIYFWLRRSRSQAQSIAVESGGRVSEDECKAIERSLSDLQAQLSNIHERQTYLRATLSTLQTRNEEVRTELDALKDEFEEARALKAATNKKLLDAVENLAQGSLASLKTQSVALQRLREDFGLLSEKIDKVELKEVKRDWQTAANQP